MNYIIADLSKVIANSNINTYSRNKSKSGKIMLNEKDLASVQGQTNEEKVLTISGTVLTEKQALDELYKEDFK